MTKLEHDYCTLKNIDFIVGKHRENALFYNEIFENNNLIKFIIKTNFKGLLINANNGLG